MNKKEFLKELETHNLENERLNEAKKTSIINNNVIRADHLSKYEYSKEFFIVRPQENSDLYVQN